MYLKLPNLGVKTLFLRINFIYRSFVCIRLYFVISSWFATEDITVGNIGSTLKHANSVLEDRAEFISSYKNLETEFIKGALEFDQFLANEFSKKINDDNQYKISAVYSKFLFNQGFKGIVYPSVATNVAGINIAFEKCVIDQKKVIPQHAVFGVSYFRDTNSENEYLQSGNISEDGIIEWKDYPRGYMHPLVKKYYLGESDSHPYKDRVNYTNLD
ncbi:hypothetical protein [Sphingobacterium sp. JB170]|uniref:hypothetical protein n=1 Tax=Sphingobacterium sp. JB170 TaxID=1434842 RepID=UPI00097EE978|nr:hypothetical protein [Sphingobacterium sp. JB170]SJN26285.1 hypothetical protein FM107_04940 [Sphingobacterium sp. JB170]